MVRVVKIAFVAAASLAAGIAVADPLVLGFSGDPQDGNTVVISGLYFASNPNPPNGLSAQKP